MHPAWLGRTYDAGSDVWILLTPSWSAQSRDIAMRGLRGQAHHGSPTTKTCKAPRQRASTYVHPLFMCLHHSGATVVTAQVSFLQLRAHSLRPQIRAALTARTHRAARAHESATSGRNFRPSRSKRVNNVTPQHSSAHLCRTTCNRNSGEARKVGEHSRSAVATSRIHDKLRILIHADCASI